MAWTRLTFLAVFVLFEILQTGSCEHDHYNPFSAQTNKVSDMENELSNLDELGQSKIDKRQMFFNENAENFPPTPENDEYSNKRPNNLSEIDGPNQPGFPVNFNNQPDNNNRFSLPLEQPPMMNNPEIPRRPAFVGQMQQNQEQDWEKKTKVIEKSESQRNEGSYQQFSNPYMNGMGYNYNNNNFNMRNGMINNGMDYFNDRNRYNKQMSMTAYSDMGSMRNFNNEPYLEHSLGHFNKNPGGYWNPNFYKPDKGVVINFNNDCPSQSVPKYAYPPTISAQAAIASYRMPPTLISTHKIAPGCCF